MPDAKAAHWSSKDEEYLRAHYAAAPMADLAAHLFRSIKAVKSKAKVLKITRGRRHVWSSGEEKYLRDHYATTLTREIAKNLKMPLHKVYAKASRMELSKPEEFFLDPANHCRLLKGSNIGAAFRFQKDHVPANKGLRRPGYAPGRMSETQFKKGAMNGVAARLHRPIGTILADHEGYLRIKVREHDASTRGWHKGVWPLLHHQVWIEAKGPIPPAHLVVFKDRDRNNCALTNLECISKTENARRNVMWNRYPREVCEAI